MVILISYLKMSSDQNEKNRPNSHFKTTSFNNVLNILQSLFKTFEIQLFEDDHKIKRKFNFSHEKVLLVIFKSFPLNLLFLYNKALNQDQLSTRLKSRNSPNLIVWKKGIVGVVWMLYGWYALFYIKTVCVFKNRLLEMKSRIKSFTQKKILIINKLLHPRSPFYEG